MKFLGVVLAWILALALALGGLLWWVDPRGEFGGERFPSVTLDARRQKMALFRAYQREAPVEALVLGSSRSMKIDPRRLEAVTGRRTFNFTVDADRAEGYLALYRWARAQGAPIRQVYLGLDVEALHNDDEMFANFRHNAELRRMLEPGTGGRWGTSLRAQVDRIRNLYTTAYLRDTARAVLAAAQPQGRVPMMTFAADGYLHYPRWEQARQAGTFVLDREIGACVPGYLNIFREMRGLSPRRWGYVETLVREVREGGGEVVLWISPLHPSTSATLGRHTRYAALLAQTRTALRALAAQPGVSVRDYSSPDRFGSTPEEWYDCAHIDERGAERLATLLLREAGHGL